MKAKTSELNGIYYHTGKHRWVVTTRSNKKRVFIGSASTQSEAIIMKNQYQADLERQHPDFNALAHDAIAWKKKAHEIISRISKTGNAVGVE